MTIRFDNPVPAGPSVDAPAADGTGAGWRPRLKAWYQASRPPFYIATMAPLFLGFVLASQDTGQWRIGRFLLINLGAFMVHLATNLANDLFDHVLGADDGASIGGSRVIQQGLIGPRALAVALAVLYSGALATAVILTSVSGQHWIWGLIVFSGLSSFFYVAPPVKYGYRGLGEASVFLNMGFVMVAGTYLIQAESWRWDLAYYSIPIGLMVANILFYQSLPDMETDRAVGKRTLAVRLGKKNAHRLFRAWWIALWASMGALYFADLTGPLVWLGMASLPIFLKADRLIRTTGDWVTLDGHGHLVRKLYVINSLALILATALAR